MENFKNNVLKNALHFWELEGTKFSSDSNTVFFEKTYSERIFQNSVTEKSPPVSFHPC